jgi:hypothetical protein
MIGSFRTCRLVLHPPLGIHLGTLCTNEIAALRELLRRRGRLAVHH